MRVPGRRNSSNYGPKNPAGKGRVVCAVLFSSIKEPLCAKAQRGSRRGCVQVVAQELGPVASSVRIFITSFIICL